MAKLKHNDPCHCGSGRKYRSCHLRQDRERTRQPTVAASPGPVIQSTGRPRWLRVASVGLGVAGVALSVWVSMASDPARGGGVLLLTGILVVALHLFGDPPPPKDNPGDPAAINFGR